MLTSKQRSKLKSLAANLSPIGQVGKEGIGENMLKSFSECLDSRELIKINILAVRRIWGANSPKNFPPSAL